VRYFADVVMHIDLQHLWSHVVCDSLKQM